MNLVRHDGNKSVFQLSGAEKALLFKILKLYPLVPAAHHQLSRGALRQGSKNDQAMLEDALAERREQNRRQLMVMLGQKRRFVPTDDGCHLTLTNSEMEWLLQVLNDIRVGSWVALGEPGAKSPRPAELSGDSALHYAAMEFCGYLQMSLLEAFHESK